MSIIPVSVIPITPLASYVAPYPSIGNITPFTYRDGTTYLEVLYNLQDYINSTVIPFINATIGMPSSDFQTQVNVLITTINTNILAEETRVNTALASQTTANNTAITNLTNYVNAQVASIVGSSITVQDSGLSTLVNTPASLTTVALKALYANKDTETVVSTGRLTDVNLNAEFSVKSVETIVVSGRLSDTSLKTEFAAKTYEPTVDLLGTLTATGRLSDATLQTEFALKDIETIVTTGRLSDATLKATATGTKRTLSEIYLNNSSEVVLTASVADVAGVTTTANSLGGKVRATCIGLMYNANSGANRTAQLQLLCDNVVIGELSNTYELFYIASTSPCVQFTITATSAPVAGSHTWKLQAFSSAASSAVLTQATLIIEEYTL